MDSLELLNKIARLTSGAAAVVEVQVLQDQRQLRTESQNLALIS
jgi:hypothetical protein